MDEARDEVFLKNFGEGLRKTTRRLDSHSYVSFHLRGQFAKFVDSPYYSESELCVGVVTVSFFKVPPLASDALLTTLYPLLENVLQTVDHFEISCLGAPFSRLEKARNRTRRDVN
jgi:hypothetical protein